MLKNDKSPDGINEIPYLVRNSRKGSGFVPNEAGDKDFKRGESITPHCNNVAG